MCDTGCAAMSAVEDMPGTHPVAMPTRSQAMTVRIVCAATKAPRMVRIEVVAVGGDNTILKVMPPRDGRIFFRLLVDDEILLNRTTQCMDHHATEELRRRRLG